MERRGFIPASSVPTDYPAGVHLSITFRRYRMATRKAEASVAGPGLVVPPLPRGKAFALRFSRAVPVAERSYRSNQRNENTSPSRGTAKLMFSNTSSVRLFCWTLSSTTMRVGNWRPPKSFTSDIVHTFKSMPERA